MAARLRQAGALGVDLLCWRRLASGTAATDDRCKYVLVASFCCYCLIGQVIDEFDGHAAWNYFFNADPPRVISDLTQAHRGAASINSSAAHPFVVVLLNPIAAGLARVLCGANLLAVLLLSHAAAALANVFIYRLLRDLAVRVEVALGAAFVHACATPTLVFGSMPETAPFATLGIVLSLWLTLRPHGVVLPALAHAFAYGMNAALLPHALLAAPMLWAGREPVRRWLSRCLLFWACTAFVVVLLFALQRRYYPGINLLAEHGYDAYADYLGPSTWHALRHRATRLVPHLLWFCVVAPVPLLTDAPDRISTFMWEQKQQIASYSGLGTLATASWTALLLTACASLCTGPALRSTVRNFILLTIGWYVGVFALFSVFGDDLLLYSFLWTSHLIVFVALGIERAADRVARCSNTTIRGLCVSAGPLFLLLLIANQLDFIRRLISHYLGADGGPPG
jgi:hypothetical protein